jgi:hypothetical protein
MSAMAATAPAAMKIQRFEEVGAFVASDTGTPQAFDTKAISASAGFMEPSRSAKSKKRIKKIRRILPPDLSTIKS